MIFGVFSWTPLGLWTCCLQGWAPGFKGRHSQLKCHPPREVCWPCGQNQLYCPETLAIVLPGFIFIKMLTPSFSFICLLHHWRISSRRTELLPTLFSTISQHLEPSLTPNRSSNISRMNALGKQWWALGHNSSSFSK